jgi:hypothetical protein
VSFSFVVAMAISFAELFAFGGFSSFFRLCVFFFCCCDGHILCRAFLLSVDL